MTLADVRWLDITHIDDDRGTLTALENSELPFAIQRIFYMHRVPSGHERGGHAHRHTDQCVIAVAGTVSIDVSDGTRTETFRLDNPNRGLYMPRMIWVRLYEFAPTAVALVLCSTPYNPRHVIRSWDDYRRLVEEPSLTA